ncbi:MAG TPA: hypothetical protein VFV19_01990 [Candidatus Polarisedimenticolaceae bacterium]|nr:hypothetical protein [Candidatus Polarisedimenticolaceae bacterium]
MTRAIGFGAALLLPLLAMADGASTKAPAYSVKDEVVVSGKVVDVKTIPDWMGKDGVNLTIEGEKDKAPHVDVAPARFLAMLDVALAVGDQLEVRGCWSQSADGSPVFLVHQIKKQRTTLNVRGPDGTPLW